MAEWENHDLMISGAVSLCIWIALGLFYLAYLIFGPKE